MNCRLIFFLYPLLLFTFVVPLKSQTIEKEEEAIKTTIHNVSKDLGVLSLAELTQKYYLLDEHTLVCASFIDSTYLLLRKDDLLTRKQPLRQVNATYNRDSFVIKVDGNIAHATCSGQYTVVQTGEIIHFFETRVLEKVAGVWKIHVLLVHESRYYKH
jgi:hypothetical protein